MIQTTTLQVRIGRSATEKDLQQTADYHLTTFKDGTSAAQNLACGSILPTSAP